MEGTIAVYCLRYFVTRTRSSLFLQIKQICYSSVYQLLNKIEFSRLHRLFSKKVILSRCCHLHENRLFRIYRKQTSYLQIAVIFAFQFFQSHLSADETSFSLNSENNGDWNKNIESKKEFIRTSFDISTRRSRIFSTICITRIFYFTGVTGIFAWKQYQSHLAIFCCCRADR